MLLAGDNNISHKIQDAGTPASGGKGWVEAHLKVPGYQPWTNVPYLYCISHNRKVNLNANWDDNVNYNWAAPVLEGLLEENSGLALPARYLIDLSQPPSIRPEPCSCDSSSRYA